MRLKKVNTVLEAIKGRGIRGKGVFMIGCIKGRMRILRLEDIKKGLTSHQKSTITPKTSKTT